MRLTERDFGRLFMVGFYGSAFCPELENFLSELNPAGVILFSRNILEPRQVAELNFSIQKFSMEKIGRPMLIGVDQEGGRVKRLKDPFCEFPPAMTLAQAESAETEISKCAETTSRELGLTGFNLDFAPVLDVLGPGIEPGSTVIGDRSFGSDPANVSKLGSLFIQKMRANGILTCAKHFPGHGGIAVDSHLDLPVDTRSWELVRDRDIPPFLAAMEASVDMIMTAHVKFPNFDALYPASLSHKIVNGILRKELGFHGPIATDDLDMGAVSKDYSAEEASALAYKAGSDLLLICNSPEKVFPARASVFESTTDDPLAESRFNSSIAATESLFPNIIKLYGSFDLAKVANYFGSRSSALL